jgi:pantoate--beta-alanine ligase
MPAALIESIDLLREQLAGIRRSRQVVGLVPTMGALHAGHARLLEQARRECDRVVASIFVNPLQFDREDDLRRYPKTLADDRRLCDRAGVDFVFAPSVDTVYPTAPECTVDVGRLADHLCGKYRPGHFRSVATVVMKFFWIVQPDRAYFGEKDAQQLAIIRRMVADLDVAVQTVGVPTVREPDGLALSSRNARLSPGERQLATSLYRALQTANRLIAGGEADPAVVKRAAAGSIPEHPALRLEYLELVDPETMQPVDRIAQPVRVAAAVWVGSTRLIDNLLSTPHAAAETPPVR